MIDEAVEVVVPVAITSSGSGVIGLPGSTRISTAFLRCRPGLVFRTWLRRKTGSPPRRPYRISGQRAACGVASMVYFPAKGGLA
jgi:hypothetical protein